MKSKLLAFLFIAFSFCSQAHEGMWIPFLIEQQIFPEMQKAGCKLTPEQIYSLNKPSLTDAIVRVGGGCSGGFLSDKGLVVTNYHCVEYFITSHSTIENNYVQNGFWAKNFSEELSSPGLSVDILVKVEDISNEIYSKIPANISREEAYNLQMQIVDSLEKAAGLEKDYKVSIESFYDGNQYFRFTYLHYEDVRLVGFTSETIARYGGNVDNWNWPRNSADFALLRVYGDSLQMPNKIDTRNVPLTPKKHLKINSTGVSNGDFTMVMGYPAQTNNYATAEEIRLIHDSLNPRQITARQIRIKPIEAYMQTNDTAYLKYYSTYSDLVNYYIKWQGEQYGIEHTSAIKDRLAKEQELLAWVKTNDTLRYKYHNIIDEYNAAYLEYVQMYSRIFLFMDGLFRMDYVKHALAFSPLYTSSDTAKFSALLPKKQQYSESYFKRITPKIEMETLPEMLEYIYANVPQNYIAPTLRNKTKKERYEIYSQMLHQSFILNEDLNKKFYTLLSSEKYKGNLIKIRKRMAKDKGFVVINEFYTLIANILYPQYLASEFTYDMIKQDYMKLLMIYNKDSVLFPNANLTMRVSFGNVKGYTISEKESYSAQSTEVELLSKMASGIKDYKKDENMLKIIANKDFGNYLSDTLYMNFVATNQTSGGSSGAPVLDAYGNFIGINFDRNWQGTMGDFNFDESVCRNISVDVRYILFCIEKIGNSSNILSELEFVK